MVMPIITFTCMLDDQEDCTVKRRLHILWSTVRRFYAGDYAASRSHPRAYNGKSGLQACITAILGPYAQITLNQSP
jgi:hypothetical protein